MADWNGPYIICLSFERSTTGPQSVAGEVQIELVRGSFMGRIVLSVALEYPDGGTAMLADVTRVSGCDGPDDPGLAVQAICFDATQTGTHWLQLRCGERLLAKLPVRL